MKFYIQSEGNYQELNQPAQLRDLKGDVVIYRRLENQDGENGAEQFEPVCTLSFKESSDYTVSEIPDYKDEAAVNASKLLIKDLMNINLIYTNMRGKVHKDNAIHTLMPPLSILDNEKPISENDKKAKDEVRNLMEEVFGFNAEKINPLPSLLTNKHWETLARAYLAKLQDETLTDEMKKCIAIQKLAIKIKGKDGFWDICGFEDRINAEDAIVILDAFMSLPRHKGEDQEFCFMGDRLGFKTSKLIVKSDSDEYNYFRNDHYENLTWEYKKLFENREADRHYTNIHHKHAQTRTLFDEILKLEYTQMKEQPPIKHIEEHEIDESEDVEHENGDPEQHANALLQFALQNKLTAGLTGLVVGALVVGIIVGYIFITAGAGAIPLAAGVGVVAGKFGVTSVAASAVAAVDMGIGGLIGAGIGFFGKLYAEKREEDVDHVAEVSPTNR